MTANIQYKGTDLDLIFETPASGAAHIAIGYRVAGVDIASRFSDLAARSKAGGNFGARIPPTGVYTATGTDFSNIFVPRSSLFALTAPLAPTHVGFTSPATLTHRFTVTFASAAALTSYFLYGGRITIAPTQSAGTVADTDLAAMFTQIGSVIIYDQGTYITGAGTGVVVNNAVIGGSNIGTTPTTLITATEATLYTANTYAVNITANGAIGAATVLTINVILTLVTHGTVADSYTGTYTSNIGQRNYPATLGIGAAQTVPTFATTVAP